MKTTTEEQSIQRIAELRKGGEHKIFFLLVFSVFSVPLWWNFLQCYVKIEKLENE
jgi:hypothetical protein